MSIPSDTTMPCVRAAARFAGLLALASALTMAVVAGARAQDWSGLNDRWRNIGGIFPVNAPVTAIARRPDIIDLFVTGNDGRVYTSWWVAGSDWSGVNDRWRNIGGVFPPGAPVTAVARTPGIIDLFITGNDGRVYTSWWVEGRDWSGVNDRWRNIGGIFPPGAPVAAVARNPGQLDLFITGNDGRVYTSWWTEKLTDWSGLNDRWRNIGGVFPRGAPVSVVARRPEQLDLFITGNDGRVYTSWWVAGSDWSGVNDRWRNIGGVFPPGAPVGAVARKPGQLDLFITGNDGRVYTSWWAEGVSDWSGLNDRWRNIGGVFPRGAPVSAVARKPEQLDLFITGNDGRVYTSWWVGGVADWSGLNDRWRNIGGIFPVGKRVSAIARTPDQLDLFITGNDGRVYTSWWAQANTVYNLIVGRFNSSTLTDADADRILGDANTVLQGSDGTGDVLCPVEFRRNGAVTAFNTGNGTIASTADFNAVATRNVSVVNVISFCNGTAGPGLSIIGCGRTPGNAFVVVRIGAANEGQLWAHEFGHNKGLPDTTGATDVMSGVLDATTRRVSQTECNAYRNATTGVVPVPGTGALLAAGNLDTFVLRHYFEGIPYDQARSFGSGALPRLLQLLADPANRPFQANIVSVIGIVGGKGAGDALIDYVRSNEGRVLDPDTYRGALTAVLALGLVAHAGDASATDYLVERARALAAAAEPSSGALRLEAATVGQQAVLGLALSGRAEGNQVLQQLRSAQIRAIQNPDSLLSVSESTLQNVRERGVADTLRLRR